MNKVTEIAKMIDHSLLHPTMTDEEMKKGCQLAVKYNVASICIKPYAVKQMVEWLHGSDVLPGCVIGFPHGNSSIDVKAFETEQALKDGAVEIDMVVNIGKVLGGDWSYVEKEIGTIVAITKKHKTVLKVIFENDFLPADSFKIRLCEICTKLKVDFVKTSSGYGFVRGEDGKYSYRGATIADLKLMRKYSGKEVGVKAAGGVRTLDELLAVKEAGATRVGASATDKIMEEAIRRFS
jgi:deoxyribose-phosphate aldolase